jgi:outer membrane protein OmpA-like peptidoglycan-associated protein
LLIIEGQASRDSDASAYNRNYNYVLSYRRALALVEYWEEKDTIYFNDKYCELIISGSGWDNPFRVEPDVIGNRENQRFVIHIIPKTGVIEDIQNKK